MPDDARRGRAGDGGGGAFRMRARDAAFHAAGAAGRGEPVPFGDAVGGGGGGVQPGARADGPVHRDRGGAGARAAAGDGRSAAPAAGRGPAAAHSDGARRRCAEYPFRGAGLAGVPAGGGGADAAPGRAPAATAVRQRRGARPPRAGALPRRRLHARDERFPYADLYARRGLPGQYDRQRGHGERRERGCPDGSPGRAPRARLCRARCRRPGRLAPTAEAYASLDLADYLYRGFKELYDGEE